MIAIERKQAYLQVSARDLTFVAEQHLSTLLQGITELRLQVNLLQNSGISLHICLNDVGNKIARFITLMEPEFEIQLIRNVELITVRHDKPELLQRLLNGKQVLFYKRIPETVQYLVKG